MYLSYAWLCVFIARSCFIVWKQRFELIDAHDRANKPHGRVQLSGKFYWGILIHTHNRVFFWHGRVYQYWKQVLFGLDQRTTMRYIDTVVCVLAGSKQFFILINTRPCGILARSCVLAGSR